MQGMGSSVIRELLKLTQKEGLISFAGGLPAPTVFPIPQFEEAAARILKDNGPQALQYSPTEGYLPLRELIAEKMSRYGIQATPDNILITTGAQQALDIIGKILIDPGDIILTETPTYLGAIQAWKAYQAEFVTVPIDDDGIYVDERLNEALQIGPKFMYILPNFQNPAGVTLSLERRKKLVQIADQHGIPIIEDDPYGDLRFEGEHLPPLLVLDGQLKANRRSMVQDKDFSMGDVIYLGTFSKTLAPGLRLGWMVAPPHVIKQCVMSKQGADLHTSTFNQMLAYEVAKDGFIDQHKQLIRRVYQERRDVMLAAMEKYFPPGTDWTHPKGGLFLWVTFPEGIDEADLLEKAIENNVAFVPGTAFYPGGTAPTNRHSGRFNFSNATPKQIEIGIQRLGEVLHNELVVRGKKDIEYV
jgi:2-aminoadipate transaminase